MWVQLALETLRQAVAGTGLRRSSRWLVRGSGLRVSGLLRDDVGNAAQQEKSRENSGNLHLVCAGAAWAVIGWATICGLSMAPVISHWEPLLLILSFACLLGRETVPLIT